jgi:gamma-glutamyltranspeptidase/glutathione hydrolase
VLLVEKGHARLDRLVALGHRVRTLEHGNVRFGSVVCAGWIDGQPVAAADWRRETAAGVV